MEEYDSNPSTGSLERRTFIVNALKVAGASAILTVPGFSMAMPKQNYTATYTVQDIINIILKEIPGTPFAKTVDTLKSGSANQTVSGIVSTMFATVKVIREAARLKANFIIAHEPTFYNHEDNVDWVKDSHIVKLKQELLAQNNIAVWRFHDYWHSHRPDGIRNGFLKDTGWLSYYQPDKQVMQLPSMSLQNLANHLKTSLHIDHVRVIGDLSQSCSKVALLPGASGGQSQMSLVERERPDVLIVGEVHEWETAEYIRDSIALDNKIGLIVLGHSVSEEAGMGWLVDWLQPKIPELKVSHIASESPFIWV